MNDDIVFFAFRYALGRRTGAVTILCDYLKENWKDIPAHTQDMIQREIKQEIDRGGAGMDCDVRAWEEILSL